MTSIDIRHGDCLEVLRSLPGNSVDSVVTDPPYGLSNTKPAQVADVLAAWVTGETEAVPAKKGGFMGKDWDSFVPPPAVWEECMRVLKPGGHMAVFAGARTQDLMGLSIRLAGFEIRDTLGWVYGSGFPKSMDLGKAIDKQKHKKDDTLRFTLWLRKQCEVLGISKNDLDKAAGTSDMGGWWTSSLPHRCAIPTAEQWGKIENLVGALPEWAEPLIAPSRQPNENWEKREVVGVKRVNGAEGSAGGFANGIASQRGLATGAREVNITAPATDEAKRWDGWGTALKPAIEPIILARKPLDGTVAANVLAHGVGGLNIDASRVGNDVRINPSAGNKAGGASLNMSAVGMPENVPGREVSGRFPANVLLDEHAAKEMDEQSGVTPGGSFPARRGADKDRAVLGEFKGQDGLTARKTDSGGASRFFPVFKYQAKAPKKERPVIVREDGTKVQHPTVKPLELMSWLVTLITPEGGTVLDPFAGTGTTLQAARDKGFAAIGVEQDADYIELIKQRLSA